MKKIKNFWNKLPKPFFILAPMDDVTDVVFRQVVANLGKPDILFTEFTNVEGLQSAGRPKLIDRLAFDKSQRPIVAQIWGINPENYYKTAKEIAKMGFDGIDINMGCPVADVSKIGACSALIKNPKLAKEIIEATKKGAGDLPVSVKTRLGYDKIATEEWIGFLLTLNLVAITIHGRTKREMSKVPAHWDEIKKAVEMRDKMGSKTLIIGNGDVVNYEDGIQKAKETGVDGIMIGRGIFKDLFCFLPESKKPQLSVDQMLDLLLGHAHLFIKTWGDGKNFQILRKFFKIYVSGFENASELREKLMESNSMIDVEKIVKEFKKNV